MTNIALVVSVFCTLLLVARFLQKGEISSKRNWVSWFGVLIGAVGAVATYNLEALGAWRFPVSGLLAGLAAAMALLDFPDSDEPSALGAPLGLAAVLIGVFNLDVKAAPLFALSAVVGSGAAAGILALNQRSRASGVFAAVGVAGLCSLALGSSITPTEGVVSTVRVLTMALLSLVLGEGLGLITQKSKVKWPQFGTTLVFAGLGSMAVTNNADFPELSLVVAGSALVAAILSVVTQRIKDTTYSVLVGSLVWLGVGTAAFSFGKGYGLALAATVAVCASSISGERRSMVWCSPLLALAVYRFARFAYPDTTRTFDIGQHYAIVGLVLGILVPLVLLEWGRSVANRSQVLGSIAAGLTGLAALVGTSVAVAFLGAKGASGLVIGYLVMPVVSSIKGLPPTTSLATGVSLAAWTVVSIGAFSTGSDIARPDKVRLLLTVGMIVASLIIASCLLTMTKEKEAQ